MTRVGAVEASRLECTKIGSMSHRIHADDEVCCCSAQLLRAPAIHGTADIRLP